jgi:hypothetical protein
MRKSSICLFGGALLGAGLGDTALADIHLEDTIEFISIDSDYGDYAYGVLEIHTIDFTVLSDGNVQLDMLSWGVFDSYIDTQITLFNNDGNPLSNANFISYNDDSYTHLNGSVDSHDSFIDIFLTAGDYTAAVGALLFSATQAENGSNSSYVSSFIGGTTASDGGQYYFDIFGDVALTVPAPGALALLGFSGLAATRRRR